MAEQRYRVIERLEAGGMAEVFIGEAASVQGFKKRVAIKRVLPHLAQNKNFMGMFLDEARLGARLDHANIVSVFDIGAADNTYFLVMEYVDGANLKGVMEALRKQGRTFPLKEAMYLSMEACRGLSYAHELTDDEGVPLNLVHRDVSPPNILISKRGEVKVTDFGLAKATTQLERTDPGVVKGKFSYLSPEAALGQPVDARADIFAMGIVLWEMLAGRRLFLGETDYQTVKLVQQANIPSLQRLNSEVDAELEQVLFKALTQSPDQRYQSARELGDALAGYLFSHQLKVTSYDIATLVKQALTEKTERTAQDQSIIDRLIQEELLRFTSLDDMGEEGSAGSAPLSPEDVDGAQPLDAGLFENPADWFANDADVNAAMAGPESGSSEGSAPGWHEAGIEQPEAGGDADAEIDHLFGEPERAPQAAQAQAAQAQAAQAQAAQARAAQARAGGAAPAAAAPAAAPRAGAHATVQESEKGGGGWVFFVVAVVILAGAGAAAWFTGLIPH
jgi:serine/threonine-protein kinase